MFVLQFSKVSSHVRQVIDSFPNATVEANLLEIPSDDREKESGRKVYSQPGRQNTEENGLPHPRLGDKLEEKPSQSLLT